MTLKDKIFILEYILENSYDLEVEELNLLDELVQRLKFRYFELQNKGGINK